MRGLLLAAHGDGEESKSNRWARAMARRLGRSGGFDEALATFQKGTPGFAESLDAMRSTDITVVPLMASAGYYAHTVLPRELARNRRYSEVRLKVLEPLGTWPQIGELAAERVPGLLASAGWALATTSLVVVGHGTARHPQSRASTDALRDRLSRGLGLREVKAAFLDESPGPEQVLSELDAERIVVLPFLMGEGTHATADIPRRFAGPRPLLIDRPLGTWSEIDQLIAAQLNAPRARREGATL